ncbi:MAG TPA: 2OG-Fe(II) oxygenase family protein [Burkholderiales bacterium]|nr:2OG-Fe(II) oxygenase family protein [Burkholderiales bacterium]
MTLPEAHALASAQAPVLDFSAISAAPAGRKALAREIADVCRDIGFFYIVEHGIPGESVRSMFAAAERFFALALDAKMELSLTRSRDYRGYLPLRMIGEGAGLKGNLYESFMVWPDLKREGAARGRQPRSPNVWPRELPELEALMLGYAAEVNRVAVELARLFALGLDLPEDSFLQFLNDPIALLRFLHYPPQAPTDFDGSMGLRPHTDAGAFTILAQDSVGGLEILGRDGAWIAVPPIAGSFVVNLGEMMKVWTDGIFTSTPHRVINRYGHERYSIPFFYYADYDAPLKPVIRNPAHSSAPEFYTSIGVDAPATAGEHLARIHRTIWPSADVQQIK